MERLWSPWRLAYVTRTARGEHESCVFCENNGLDTDLVVFTGTTCFVVLNLYPYNNGHLMVVPYRHTPSLATLTVEELHEMADLEALCEKVLVEAYTPHGVNVGINLGKPAGAGVLEHVHVHLVPRWNGDTNFMTVVGATRVLPEDLQQSAARLKPIFAKLG
jgi:ATP adenylyltransferase